jgi:single-strand DNA-binding protein
MSNWFTGFGNVGTAPTLRRVPVDGEQRPVTDLRVYFDRRVPKGEDGFEEEGGFWLTVSVWGARAETVARLIEKGARIYVEGSLRQVSWQDRESGADRSELRLTADAIALDLLCVEAVQYRKRDGSRGISGGSGGTDVPDEEIPY